MDVTAIKRRYTEALDSLAGNVCLVQGYDKPVLIEGGAYEGIWLECGPLEGLVYGRVRPEISRNNHDIFFSTQREDGYIHCWLRKTRIGSAQIQMVVPIAASALETSDMLGDEGFLAKAYSACGRWDAWLAAHRDTRGTGLCEAFCEYDTGHDNSPRFKDLPKKCPGDDAAVCPTVGKLPYLAPDLSASVYGGRRALAQMARRLGKAGEAGMWEEKAEAIRRAIMKHCFDPEDECFYDVDRDGAFVKVRGDALTRVLGEHVVDEKTFERIYRRYIHNPAEFWTPYPLPSISIADPQFVKSLSENSWGGASQALTALRAPRWFEHYGKKEDLKTLMTRWVEAITKAPGFMQQMSPWTGEFTTSAGYSPAMLVYIDFVDRLGVMKEG
jgi:hypothetical protein